MSVSLTPHCGSRHLKGHLIRLCARFSGVEDVCTGSSVELLFYFLLIIVRKVCTRCSCWLQLQPFWFHLYFLKFISIKPMCHFVCLHMGVLTSEHMRALYISLGLLKWVTAKRDISFHDCQFTVIIKTWNRVHYINHTALPSLWIRDVRCKHPAFCNLL